MTRPHQWQNLKGLTVTWCARYVQLRMEPVQPVITA